MADTSSAGASSKETPPEWSPLSGDEVKELVVKLGRDGHAGSKIGVILRDQYAVPSIEAATGKSVHDILADNDMAPPVPEDLHMLIKRAVNLRNHLADNPRDLHNRRALELIESRVRRLAKYYKKQGRIPFDWRYTRETAKLLAE